MSRTRWWCTVDKPRPRPTPVSQPYWDALAAGHLEIPRCDSCSRLVFYPRVRCPHCGGESMTWERVEPTGTLVTVTATRQPTAPMFADDVPQRIAIVELDAGVRVTTTLVDVGDAPVEIGARVEGRFVAGDEGVTMLHFAPANA